MQTTLLRRTKKVTAIAVHRDYKRGAEAVLCLFCIMEMRRTELFRN